MKTEKAFVCVLLILAICLGLTACGGASLPMITAPDTAQADTSGETRAAGKTGKAPAETKEPAETDAPVTEQPAAPEPKLCAEVKLTRDGVTSWITYTYEGDLLVRKYDSYQGDETLYRYSEDGKTVITKDRYGNVTGESRYNTQEQLIPCSGGGWYRYMAHIK